MDARLQTLVDKGYDPELVVRLSSFTKEEVESCVSQQMINVKGNLEVNIEPIAIPSGNPHVYFVGGQPGSGKSSAMYRISKMESDYGVVNVEMDSYRTMNTRVDEIKKVIADFYKDKDIPNASELMSSDFVAFTQGFADSVADLFTEELFKQGYNIAIESTLRHPNGKLELAQQMRQANPNCVVSIIMMGISHDVALQGALSRAQQMEICLKKMVNDAKANGIDVSPISRGAVNKQYYDSVCDDLPYSMEVFSDMAYANIINGNVQIQDRNGNIYYDRNKDGLSKSARDVEESALHGSLAKIQIEESRQQKENYFGVRSFVSENKKTVSVVYGSTETASKYFQEEVEKIKDKLGTQAVELFQVVNSISVLEETSNKTI